MTTRIPSSKLFPTSSNNSIPKNMKPMPSQHLLPSKDMEEVEVQAEEAKSEELANLRYGEEEEVDKEAADYSAGYAKPQGAPTTSSPPTTFLTAIGGLRKMLKTSES